MITQLYTQPVPLSESIAEASREIFTHLVRRQADIVNMYYNRRREPHLADALKPDIVTVRTNRDRVETFLGYPTAIRFLDMRKIKISRGRKTGKYVKKRYYYPVYNRPLWGHVYGSGYSLSNVINAVIGRTYQNYLTNQKNVFYELYL